MYFDLESYVAILSVVLEGHATILFEVILLVLDSRGQIFWCHCCDYTAEKTFTGISKSHKEREMCTPMEQWRQVTKLSYKVEV